MAYSNLHIEHIQKVFDDGNHNAFTDLCNFKGDYYLTFRSCPDGHGVNSTSRIIIMSSKEGESWKESCSFKVNDRDTRDPHFLSFRDHLFVYTGCWQEPKPDGQPDLNDQLGFAVHTSDGRIWKGPTLLEGTYGHYIWRAAKFHGKAYLCARRKKKFAPSFRRGESPEEVQATYLESNNGLVWSFGGYFAKTMGNETAFLFEEDGSMLALVRGRGDFPARICRSNPPYTEWTRKELEQNVGGPLLVRWGNEYLVGGRNTTEPGNPKTTLYWLVGEHLEEALELPSAGDNSYPGFVSLGKDSALISYYSAHENRQPSIYLAKVVRG